MHNHVDHRWIKTILNKIIKIIICLTLVYTPFFANASAAEKWEYEPVMKDLNIHVKGYKVDQYGNAVNDYEYNTKIDPKTTTNRQKMGTVGMGRLLKTSGWGLLGSVALEALLEAVDWIIDPEAQSIWRNKSGGGGDSFNCIYLTKIHDGTTQIKEFYSNDDKSNCPYDIALKRLEYRLKTTYANMPYIKELKFVEWNPALTPDTTNFRFKFSIHRSDTSNVSYEYLDVPYKNVDYKPPQPVEKEYLTPEQLADYANKTHPDYADPQLAPKLEPHYSPKIAEDLWKPSNPWEEVNSPTVQEVQKKLDQAQPEPKKDAEIKPNPETGGSVLPKFCDWAAPVCEFIKDDKDIPDTEPEQPKELDIGQLNTDTFKAPAGCPSPLSVDTTFGKTGTVQISYEPICLMAEKWSFVAPLIGFISGAMILIGVGRKGEDGEI